MRARGAREQEGRKTGGRERVTEKGSKGVVERDRRSMTMRAKHPLVYHLESNKRMLNYRNVRRRAEERVCAREVKEKRQADLRVREREQRERRIAAGTLVVRQRTFTECTKKRGVIPETDSDEEEGGSVL
jgi:hypothetical protein